MGNCFGTIPFFCGGWGVGGWCSLWLHLMFWNAGGPSLHDNCISTEASEVSELYPTEESLLRLCTCGWMWWFECFYVNEKWSRVEIWNRECPRKYPILWELCNTIYFDVPAHYSPVKRDYAWRKVIWKRPKYISSVTTWVISLCSVVLSPSKIYLHRETFVLLFSLVSR